MNSCIKTKNNRGRGYTLPGEKAEHATASAVGGKGLEYSTYQQAQMCMHADNEFIKCQNIGKKNRKYTAPGKIYLPT